MLDFNSPLGEKILGRLRQEKIIWLTTVDAHSAPQPRPVWFEWDGQTVLIFSQPTAAKVRHIANNPRVALNFNSTEDGDAVAVLVGQAKALTEPVASTRLQAYLQKYQQSIQDIGTTPEGLEREYSVPVLVTPQSMRGF